MTQYSLKEDSLKEDSLKDKGSRYWRTTHSTAGTAYEAVVMDEARHRLENAYHYSVRADLYKNILRYLELELVDLSEALEEWLVAILFFGGRRALCVDVASPLKNMVNSTHYVRPVQQNLVVSWGTSLDPVTRELFFELCDTYFYAEIMQTIFAACMEVELNRKAK